SRTLGQAVRGDASASASASRGDRGLQGGVNRGDPAGAGRQRGRETPFDRPTDLAASLLPSGREEHPDRTPFPELVGRVRGGAQAPTEVGFAFGEFLGRLAGFAPGTG